MNQQVKQLSFFDRYPVAQPRRAPSTASLRKSNGQFLALKRAGKVWHDNTIIALKKFIDRKMGGVTSEFTFEEFRIYCEQHHMDAPASLNAWGSIPKSACKLGLCEWSGRYQAAIRPASHGRTIKVWNAL